MYLASDAGRKAKAGAEEQRDFNEAGVVSAWYWDSRVGKRAREKRKLKKWL